MNKYPPSKLQKMYADTFEPINMNFTGYGKKEMFIKNSI